MSEWFRSGKTHTVDNHRPRSLLKAAFEHAQCEERIKKPLIGRPMPFTVFDTVNGFQSAEDGVNGADDTDEIHRMITAWNLLRPEYGYVEEEPNTSANRE